MKTIVEGILELITSLTPGGENVYGIDIDTGNPGESLYELFGDYEGKKVRLVIEEVEECNEEIIPRTTKKVTAKAKIINKGRKITKFDEEY